MGIETYLGLPREKFQSENLCEKLSQMRQKTFCRGCTVKVQSKGQRKALHVLKSYSRFGKFSCKSVRINL